MKKIWTLLVLQLATIWGAHAQKEISNNPKEIKRQITNQHHHPQTAKRAAHADVLLVPSRRWTSGHPNIPANYTLGPNPSPKPKP